MVSFEVVKRHRVSDEVVLQLARAIIAHELAPGERLPPERGLAETLGVNRSSLREGLRRLEHMGLVEVKPGDGVYVQEHSLTAGIELIRFMVGQGIGIDGPLLADLAETRRLVVTELVRLAATRRAEPGMTALRRSVDRYQAATIETRLGEGLDFEFFQALARATGNQVLVFLVNSMRTVIHAMSATLYALEAAPQRAIDTYGKTLEAIEWGAADEAVDLMTAHMARDDALITGASP